jgi:hypothetical protein
MRKLLPALLVAALCVVHATATFAENKPATPIKALLVLGGCCHDYKAQQDILKKGLAERANIEVTIAYEPDSGTKKLNPVYEKEDWAAGYDVVIHDECSCDVNEMKIVDRILAPHKAGLPAVFLHCGMHSFRTTGWNDPKTPSPWMELTGLQTSGHGAQLPIEIKFEDKSSPITKGLEDWTTVNEELYNNFAGKVMPTARILAKGTQKPNDTCVCVWTNDYNSKAKVFSTTLGHNNATVSDPRYLDLVTRGLLWTTGHLADDGKPAPGYGPAGK